MYWIKNAIKHPGALHKELHVPKGEKIPKDKLEKAAHKKGIEGKRARLAETLEGMHHGKKHEKHESKKAEKAEHKAGVKGDKKLHKMAVAKKHHAKKDKMKKVMKEFSEGKLHSSSKSGPIVKEKAQALAIGYSEAKKAAKKKK